MSEDREFTIDVTYPDSYEFTFRTDKVDKDYMEGVVAAPHNEAVMDLDNGTSVKGFISGYKEREGYIDVEVQITHTTCPYCEGTGKECLECEGGWVKIKRIGDVQKINVGAGAKQLNGVIGPDGFKC